MRSDLEFEQLKQKGEALVSELESLVESAFEKIYKNREEAL